MHILDETRKALAAYAAWWINPDTENKINFGWSQLAHGFMKQACSGDALQWEGDWWTAHGNRANEARRDRILAVLAQAEDAPTP